MALGMLPQEKLDEWQSQRMRRQKGTTITKHSRTVNWGSHIDYCGCAKNTASVARVENGIPHPFQSRSTSGH